jgi:urease accessory protein UreH
VTEYSLIGEIVKTLSLAGLVVWVVYRLVDKWAGKFLEAQMEQATAMGKLAGAVETAQGRQDELSLSMRVLASKVDEVREWIRNIQDRLAERSAHAN